MVELVFPQLAALYAAAGPVAEALLRAAVGLLLVPHGLRMTFGIWAAPNAKTRNLRMMMTQLDADGYRPGALWAPLIAATELIAGPLLAMGLFTRPAALPIVIFMAVTIYERRRIGSGWFWGTQGMEYPVLWFCGALYFLAQGGGAYSLDRLLGWEF